ncbi:MAG TPA: dTMP kinase, partial [Anaerolineae bacterium]|nr:dTMP kinase [Anaerolineae bacterium]
TFEGPDGSGKSTQIKLLSEALTAAGYDVLTVREPGGTAISEQIRDVVHSLRNREMSDRAECLLYNAARAQLVDQLIVPHLRQRSGIVLSDRYADSTLAYQGYGRGLDLSAVRSVIAFATNNLKPDVTFYLDLAVEEGIERRKRGGGEWNRLDDQTLEFHRRVRAGYLQMVQEDPQRWVCIDGARAVEVVQADIWKVVSRLVG